MSEQSSDSFKKHSAINWIAENLTSLSAGILLPLWIGGESGLWEISPKILFGTSVFSCWFLFTLSAGETQKKLTGIGTGKLSGPFQNYARFVSRQFSQNS